jgi:diguanylate cyclase (GGDEF)-like protein
VITPIASVSESSATERIVWAAQLRPLIERTPWTLCVLFACAAFASIDCGWVVPATVHAGWWSLFGLAALVYAMPWLAQKFQIQPVLARTPLQAWVLAVAGAALGALIALVPLATWSALTEVARVEMLVLLIGLLVVGGLWFVSLPRAALLWVTTVGGLLIVGTTWVIQPSALRAAIIATLALGVLLWTVGTIARGFKALHVATTEADRQRTTVELLLQDFQEEAREWLWETDAQGRLVFASPRLSETLGFGSKALENTPLVDVLLPHAHTDVDAAKARALLVRVLGRVVPFRNHIIETDTNNGPRWISLSAKPLKREDGVVVGWRGTGIDVTADFRRQHEMERLAMLDPLTGLANRLRLNQELEHFFPALRLAQPCTLMLLDLDDFKYINDHYGHPTGDRLLQLIALRLQQQMRPGQLLARLGGDEFALVIPGEVPRASAVEMGERVLATMAQPYMLDDLALSVRCSIGVALGGQDAHDAKSLLKCADLALYAAKDAGRNALRFFGYDMHRKLEDRFLLTEEMRRGLDRGEFELLFQPFVRTATGEVTGFEALVRWNHPSRGVLRPEQFISVAEETVVIDALGAWVLRAACKEALRWPEHLRVAVNVSAAQFSHLDLRGTIEHALLESGLPPQRLEVELTESTLFEDPAAARRTMLALRQQGVQISLDDFGAGHASLNHLRSFPISRLKIDRSFTAAIADATREGNEARSIVRAAIELAHAMCLEATAEGVETLEQLAILRQSSCDEVQGYFIEYPISGAELLSYLERAGDNGQQHDPRRAMAGD